MKRSALFNVTAIITITIKIQIQQTRIRWSRCHYHIVNNIGNNETLPLPPFIIKIIFVHARSPPTHSHTYTQRNSHNRWLIRLNWKAASYNINKTLVGCNAQHTTRTHSHVNFIFKCMYTYIHMYVGVWLCGWINVDCVHVSNVKGHRSTLPVWTAGHGGHTFRPLIKTIHKHTFVNAPCRWCDPRLGRRTTARHE